MNKRFIDLFCGIGGFRLGFSSNGYKSVYSSDYNKHCQKVYFNNFNEMPYGDITKINPNEIPEFDVLTAGFPCQPFSISGHKKGFEDTRGTLFFDICNIIQLRQPSVVVLENVKHLINHDKKRTFKTIIDILNELGYNTSHEILNSKDFGLPQNRERIFIVASKNGSFDFSKLIRKKSKPLNFFLEKLNDDMHILNPSEYTLIDPSLTKKQSSSGLWFVGYRNKPGFKNGVRPGTLHLNRTHRQPNRIYSSDGYHPTIPSQESSGRFFIHDTKNKLVRKLTINECYKIMGFPDNFIKK